MKIVRGLHNLPPNWSGCVATIGNFDGVHRGHQAVLQRMHTLARTYALPTLLMTFEPHPSEFFRPQQPPARLCSIRDKILALRNQGLQHLLIIRFNAKLAALSAEDFIATVLVRRLKIKALVIGDDFRFGAARRGDFAMLQSAGGDLGFTVSSTPSFVMEGERVSSTGLRLSLEQADFAKVAQHLGRPYTISGRVGKGDARGRQLGFPTANLSMRHRQVPLRGVFAVRVHGLAYPRNGVANIGTRPTVDGSRTKLEVHVLDFDENLYGRCIEVEFVAKIRDEMRFASLAELTAQIAHDVQQGRSLLQSK